MNILNPPKSYIDFRCATHEWEISYDFQKERFNQIRSKFFEQFKGTEEEIKVFCNYVYEARHERTLPFEKIEIKENDGKKHGRVCSVMIFDIEYWRENGKIKRKKIYTANQGELSEHNQSRIKTEKFPLGMTLKGKEAEEFEQKRKIAKEKAEQIDLKMRSIGEREPGQEG